MTPKVGEIPTKIYHAYKRLYFNDYRRVMRRELDEKRQKVEDKMYTKLMKRVTELVGSELEHTRSQHPPFASLHEAYAVTLEEVDEARMDMGDVVDALDLLWAEVRADDPKNAAADAVELEKAACRLACEAVQVAAMARKTIECIEKGEADED